MQIPSQVWVGSNQVLLKEVTNYLQTQFCKSSVEPSKACLRCATCLQIANRQFYQIAWLENANQYKIEQIREVLERLALQLDHGEQFYFVFTNAQGLNDASANSLLKSIEEPPLGYQFIFLVPRKELLLPTILSRSIIKTFNTQGLDSQHVLFKVFANKDFKRSSKNNYVIDLLEPIEFMTLLEKFKDLTEQESNLLIEQIYFDWLNQFKQVTNWEIKLIINQIIVILQQAQASLPMPGSSKLFWRNLYMQFVQFTNLS